MAQEKTFSLAPSSYDNVFWRFSVAVYGATGVATECLSLQDAFGIDVNVLLFCAWLGTRGVDLRRQDIETAVSAIAEWQHNIVQPLRSARRFSKMRCGDEVFRTSLKEVELKAEQIEQAILFSVSGQLHGMGGTTERRAAVMRNIEGYIAMKSGAAAFASSNASIHHLIEAALCR